MLSPSGAPHFGQVAEQLVRYGPRPLAGVEPHAAAARAALQEVRIVKGDACAPQHAMTLRTLTRPLVLQVRLSRSYVALAQHGRAHGQADHLGWYPKPRAA